MPSGPPLIAFTFRAAKLRMLCRTACGICSMPPGCALDSWPALAADKRSPVLGTMPMIAMFYAAEDVFEQIRRRDREGSFCGVQVFGSV